MRSYEDNVALAWKSCHLEKTHSLPATPEATPAHWWPSTAHNLGIKRMKSKYQKGDYKLRSIWQRVGHCASFMNH